MMFELIPKEALYVLFALFGYYTITTNFDIYISKEPITFLYWLWTLRMLINTPKHITIELFEINKTSSNTLIINFKRYFKNRIWFQILIFYARDEGSYWGNIKTTLKFVIGCNNLRLEEALQGFYFEHVMSKTCLYNKWQMRTRMNQRLCDKIP